MPEAFYEAVDGAFSATEQTRGPWAATDQHAGPPTALIGREIELLVGPEWHLGRLTVEILGPIPIAPMRLEARIVRPGRRVQLVEAELFSAQTPLARARAWVLRRRETGTRGPQGDITRAADPAEAVEKPFFDTGYDRGYHTAMEIRFLEGGFLDRGPAAAWMRMRGSLVGGEDPSALSRVLVAADVGNGISGTLDQREFLFVNTDLTVNLIRNPVGDWVLVDARTLVGPEGIGLAESVLSDREGPIGRATQTLLIAER
ncbi:MAG: thioesterase family protein [Thermoleophilaceae bacterium]|nr:thioesterase family protein [Thermoleophilaceae bacterium]